MHAPLYSLAVISGIVRVYNCYVHGIFLHKLALSTLPIERMNSRARQAVVLYGISPDKQAHILLDPGHSEPIIVAWHSLFLLHVSPRKRPVAKAGVRISHDLQAQSFSCIQ